MCNVTTNPKGQTMCEHRDAPYDHDCWTTATPEQVARMASAMYFGPSESNDNVTGGDMAGLASVSSGSSVSAGGVDYTPEQAMQLSECPVPGCANGAQYCRDRNLHAGEGVTGGWPAGSAGRVDEFTTRHCAEWCEVVGIDDAFIPEMVRALEDDGPDSHMSWPTIARSVGATFWDGVEYR